MKFGDLFYYFCQMVLGMAALVAGVMTAHYLLIKFFSLWGFA